jgi:hypothetical protein
MSEDRVCDEGSDLEEEMVGEQRSVLDEEYCDCNLHYGDKVEDEIVAEYAGFSGLNGP